jgi:hypothetical protein
MALQQCTVERTPPLSRLNIISCAWLRQRRRDHRGLGANSMRTVRRFTNSAQSYSINLAITRYITLASTSSKSRSFWSREDVEKLTELLGQNMTILEMAEVLGRSYDAVGQKARRMGFSSNHHWRQEEAYCRGDKSASRDASRWGEVHSHCSTTWAVCWRSHEGVSTDSGYRTPRQRYARRPNRPAST